MTIEEIKSLMKSGDVAGAEAAAQELLTAEPNNVQAMMLYGTCRQLQGDEATFRDTYATVKEALDANEVELDTVTAEEWKLFEMLHRNLDLPELLRKGDQPRGPVMMEYVVLAVLIAAAVVTGIVLWGGSIRAQIDIACTTANVRWEEYVRMPDCSRKRHEAACAENHKSKFIEDVDMENDDR